MTRAPTVKCRMVNPSPQFFIVPEGSPYLQAEEAGISVYEPWGDAPIAPMPVDQNQFALAHLPGLLDEFRQDAVPHDLPRVIAVKINSHADR